VENEMKKAVPDINIQDRERKDPLNIVMIGVGGIGTALLVFLPRFLQHHNPGSLMKLIDGDEYEPKNEERQAFAHPGNKATAKVEELSELFDQIIFQDIPEFVTADNVSSYICENDIVLLCVDNHKTRKIVSEYCEKINNIKLISGGNEYTHGDILCLFRKDGKSVRPTYKSFSWWHPEIRDPKDKHPGELGCLEQLVSYPQLIFINASVAITMCNLFYSTCIIDERPPGIVFLDICKYTSVPRDRG
jgi:molybdopterin/thiamine biosynthesis adenylyltransferase